MSNEEKSKLQTKLSPLIEGQVPDFVRDDHPLFVEFLKQYYKFLEAGKLTITPFTDYSRTVNYIRQETNTEQFILLEDSILADANKIVTESGLGFDDGSIGKFTNGETITGDTSGATATILVEDSENSILYISSQQKFITEETITGGTSGARATIGEYRANPVQNIQQLLDYADVDNTIYDFLDQMRDSFMESIPSTLATNTSKRNLLKNIKDLYSAKGTSEGHKLFMRLLLGEDAEIIYPNEYMMRPSGGDWKSSQILRATPLSGANGNEVTNNKITGQTSGATAVVISALTITQGTSSLTEFEISDVVGTFTDGETIKGLSNDSDVEVSFTVSSILASATITNDGVLYHANESTVVESLGNGFAAAQITAVKRGGVSDIIVDDAGTGYEVGDPLVFTNPSTDTDVESPEGYVSVVGGGVLQETGTLDDSDVTTDTIILEETSTKFIDFPQIILEGGAERDVFSGNGLTRTFNINNTSTLTDTLTLFIDGVKIEQTDKAGNAYWSVEDTPYLVLNGTDSSSTDAGDNILLEVDDAPQTGSVITLEQQTITFSELPIDRTPKIGVNIEVRGDNTNYLLLNGTTRRSFIILDGTDSSGGAFGNTRSNFEENLILNQTDSSGSDEGDNILLEDSGDTDFDNAGDFILSNEGEVIPDKFTTSSDLIVLEHGSFSSSEANSIRKAYVSNSGTGYTDLPTVAVTSSSGSSAKLLASTNDIGAIDEVSITDAGLSLSSSNPPDIVPRAHFIVKDVTGTFVAGNTLTTHEGTVKGWDSSTNVLDLEFENVVRIDGEQQSGSVNQGIAFEEGTRDLNTHQSGIVHIILEDAIDVADTSTDSIILDATAITKSTLFDVNSYKTRLKVRVVENTLQTISVSTEDAALGTKIFSIDGSYNEKDFTAELLQLERGRVYYFDLSDTSLYNVDSTKNHELVFAELSNRLKGDGSTTTFTLKNSVIEKPVAFVTQNSTSFPANVRSHFDNVTASTGYTTSGNTITFTTAPSSGDHVLIFTKYTTGVTTSEDYIEIGGGIYDDTTEAGRAFIQLELDSEAPDLYYYCVNHGPRMGGRISSLTKADLIVDEGSKVTLDGESIGPSPQGILLENGSQDLAITYSLLLEAESGSILLNGTDSNGLNNGDNIILNEPTNRSDPFSIVFEDSFIRSAEELSNKILIDLDGDRSNHGTAIALESGEGDSLILEDQFLNDSISKIIMNTSLLDYDSTLDNLVKLRKATKKSDGTLDFSVKLVLENGKEPIVLNGTDASGANAGDSILFEDAINQEDRDFHTDNAIAHLLVNEEFSFINDTEDAGGTSVLMTEETDKTNNIFNIILDGHDSSVLGDGSLITDVGDNILTEIEGDELRQEEFYSLGMRVPTSKFELEAFELEPIQHENENILLESNRTSDTEIFYVLLDGTDSSSTNAGSKLISEASSFSHDFATIEPRIILDGTDSDGSDSRGGLLFENEDVSFEEIVLNGSDSSSTDAGDNLVLETGIDFSNGNVTITDSGGASATIVKADIATVTSAVNTSSTSVTGYSGIRSLMGEDLNRIQDSYYYQDYSYEVQVGQSLSTYINELKKAVHPTGFLPFGKVSIASSISAAISTTAAGISDYTGDTDTFSPELASVLQTLFSQTVQSRLQVTPTTYGIGQSDDQIVLENGIAAGDNLVLDASAASTDEGSNILLEFRTSDLDTIMLETDEQVLLETGSFIILEEFSDVGIDLEDGALEAILYESGRVSSETTNYAYDGGGRVMAESSNAPSADADRFLVREITTKISTAPTSRASRNLLLHLAKYPFGTVDSIQLETSTANQTSFLALDGEIPLAQETTFIILESGENVFLEQPSDEGQRIVAEMDTWAFPIGFKVSENERIVLEYENEFVETIPLSEIGDFRFEDILAIDKIIMDENPVDQDNANAVENTGILMENFGQILLNGTDSSSTNAESFLAQETTKNNRFTLEESALLIVEENSTHSIIDNLVSESVLEETIVLEDFFNPRNTFGIRLEQDSYNEDVIILDGTDSSSFDAGVKLELEEYFQSGQETRPARILLEDFEHLMMETGDFVGMENETVTVFTGDFKTSAIQLETTNIISSKGQIPLGNWTLNSSTSPVGYQPVVHASEIKVRSTGEIALEDSTDTTHGFLVLNGTDSSSTNAGDNIDCEGATGITA